MEIYRDRGDEVRVLITDVAMPGIPGTELARRLAGGTPELDVTYMSGYVGAGTGNPQWLPAAAQFLQKPFTGADLITVVQLALGSAPPAASPRT